MRSNVRQVGRTHEGAPAFSSLKPIDALRRSVLSCFLFEREFYEDGEEISQRIMRLAKQVPPRDLAELAIEARQEYHLRHAPLMLLMALIARGRGEPMVSDAIENVIQRADEPGELLAMYWSDGRIPLAHQLRKGLAASLAKFDAYQLAKYDRKNAAVKLRDVFRMVRPKPADAEQAKLWGQAVAGTLPTPDTWESKLAAGADKRETFTRLLGEGRLGYMALLRNLRGMVAAGVDQDLIRDAILARKGAQRVLPFRYVAAARACPEMEPALDQAMQTAVALATPLPGRTVVLVDVSYSMHGRLSERSDLSRMDAACALAAVIPSQDKAVFSFSENLVRVPPRAGMAMIDAIRHSQDHGGTWLGRAVGDLNIKFGADDRLIVVTDEQSHDPVPPPAFDKAYMVNVASAQRGVGYGPWTHIDGFSESVIRFIAELEGGHLVD